MDVAASTNFCPPIKRKNFKRSCQMNRRWHVKCWRRVSEIYEKGRVLPGIPTLVSLTQAFWKTHQKCLNQKGHTWIIWSVFYKCQHLKKKKTPAKNGPFAPSLIGLKVSALPTIRSQPAVRVVLSESEVHNVSVSAGQARRLPSSRSLGKASEVPVFHNAWGKNPMVTTMEFAKLVNFQPMSCFFLENTAVLLQCLVCSQIFGNEKLSRFSGYL